MWSDPRQQLLYTYVYVYIHNIRKTYIHTYIQTYIHTYKQSPVQLSGAMVGSRRGMTTTWKQQGSKLNEVMTHLQGHVRWALP